MVPRGSAANLATGSIQKPLTVLILTAILTSQAAKGADEDIQFNTDVLDVKDRGRVDLSRFSRAGYIMPGKYQFALQVNKTELRGKDVSFIPHDGIPDSSEACLTPEIVNILGLKESLIKGLKWWHSGECLELNSLKGLSVRPDFGTGKLYINVPQAYMEYVADNWDPPSRWDNGVDGLIFDYSANAMNSRQDSGSQQNQLSGNGVAGINLGAWRFRADWQAQYEKRTGVADGTSKNWDWSRYYLYRPITSLRAKLTLGENYLPSSLFDSFRFTGISLGTDDNQLPPNLRGYAPEVSGVAKTNAKVTISQEGRVIYESTVAAGPFRIQDLNDTVSGKLDVRVQEQDGSVQVWQVNTASIPYLSRPGAVRYKMSVGKPSNYEHQTEGPEFATGELSWGVSNGWSMFGGGILAGKYNSFALGVGRDLLNFGAISADITHSQAALPGGEYKQGNSYRISYSKRFDEYDSQVTFAGYRFSERNFMSMSQYLVNRYQGVSSPGSGKELYTISLNKQFREKNLSTYLNYSHQTYWDRDPNDTWSGSLATYFDIGDIHNISLGITATRSIYNGRKDDGAYISLSLPWGDAGSVDYSGQFGGGQSSHSLGLYGRIDESNTYQINAGSTADGRATGSGFLEHQGNLAEVTANVSSRGNDYRAMGLSLQGGITATSHGAAVHRMNTIGGTRMMVDTGGVSGVPVRGNGGNVESNIAGKAVIGDVGNYYRSSVTVDLDALPSNVDSTRSVIQDTLTEGAIGYQKFGILAGEKAMAIIRLTDGSTPPFGATVTNKEHTQVGVSGDDGNAWLSGLQPDGILDVSWAGKVQCYIHMPKPLDVKVGQMLLLPCLTNNEVIRN